MRTNNAFWRGFKVDETTNAVSGEWFKTHGVLFSQGVRHNVEFE